MSAWNDGYERGHTDGAKHKGATPDDGIIGAMARYALGTDDTSHPDIDPWCAGYRSGYSKGRLAPDVPDESHNIQPALGEEDPDSTGWLVLDFKTQRSYFGPDTYRACVEYIAEDQECSVNDLSCSNHDSPMTVYGEDGSNTGLMIGHAQHLR